MASAQASKKLSTEIAAKLYDVDPDATTAFNVAYVDMRDYNVFMAGFFRRTTRRSTRRPSNAWARPSV